MGGSGGVLKVLEGNMEAFGGVMGMTPKSLWWGSYGVGGLLKVLEGGYVCREGGLGGSLRSWKEDLGVFGGHGWVWRCP